MIAITDAEAHVMQLLWQSSPREAREIADALEAQKGWKRTTVITLLARLEKKRAVKAVKGSRPKRYVPLIDSADYGRAETRRVADLAYGGKIATLVASFVGDAPLSPEEIEELRQLVEKLMGEDGDDKR
jgi:predicted transcriptional regulator